ncbi:hypothetical protein EXW40_25240 [Bacillus mycoides]|nr:hypothetical protein EXW40_25240 [Bacillus mycoides]
MTSLLYFYYCNKCKPKAKVARLESLDIGAPDKEALFASSEGAKWPIDSSHCSWIPIKSESGSLRM